MDPKNQEKNKLLIKRCQSGEAIAFRELYQKYAKAMLNISFRILNKTQEAEDVLQESFLKGFQGIQNFENEAAFGSWLKRVVINGSIDLIRKRKENFVSIDDLEFAEEKQEPELPEFDVETIRACIQELPDGYRIIFTLYLFENYSHKEIAEKLNISEGTSKSQYSRARQKLVLLLQQKRIYHV